MFEKEEPTLRKMNIDKLGDVEINFSSEMVFPDNWVAENDKYLDSQNVTAEARRRLRRNL